MRDRSKEIAMLEDTLKILNQGWYEKNRQKDTSVAMGTSVGTITLLTPIAVAVSTASGF
jgi:transporter, NhaC family (TC 2.A.35)